jgi:hypothetical protein
MPGQENRQMERWPMSKAAHCAGSSDKRDPALGGLDRSFPEAVRRLAAVERFPDFANRQKGTGPGLFDLQSLIVVCPDEAGKTIQDRQGLRPWPAFSHPQGLHDLRCAFEFIHGRVLAIVIAERKRARQEVWRGNGRPLAGDAADDASKLNAGAPMLCAPLRAGTAHVVKFGPVGIAGDPEQPLPVRHNRIQAAAKR